MKILTKFFEEIEIDEKDIINFSEGIPGFLDIYEYILIHDEASIFSFLQSVKNKDLCFILIPPAVIVGDYNIDISEDAVAKLGIKEPEDMLIYAIVTIPERVEEGTANLKAPILINRKNNLGLQEILDDTRYAIKHRIIKEA